jgi:hypothetical protein
MSTKVASSYVVHLLVVLVSIVFAYIIDRTALVLQDYASSTFNFIYIIIFRLVVPIFAALLMLALAWYLFRFVVSSRKTAFLYMCFGLLGVISFASNFVSLPMFLRETFIGQFRASVSQIGFGSIYYWLSCYLLVLGIVSLVRKNA